ELTIPVEVDVNRVRGHLRAGDLRAATAAYEGPLLPESEAPFVLDRRHVVDVSMRESLLASGSPVELLEFATIHPYDEAVLERIIEATDPSDPMHHEATARLSLARRPEEHPTRPLPQPDRAARADRSGLGAVGHHGVVSVPLVPVAPESDSWK